MPELPEIEHLKRTLEPILVGARVTSARLFRPSVVHTCPNPHEKTPSHSRLLVSTTIKQLLRRGKQLAIVAETGRVLCIHLGMSGRLQVLLRSKPEPIPAHTHCTWRLCRGSERVLLAFIDPRRFGGIWAFPSLELIHRERWSRLGPEAASITPHELAEALANSCVPIKAALLDQTRLAGIGNIYADEALFHAGVHPQRAAGSLSVMDCQHLADSIAVVLKRAICAGGSTLRDFVDANGNPGIAQKLHVVYGRAGQPCVRCGQPLRSIRIAQRTTTYCSRCQPLRRRSTPIVHPSQLTALSNCG